MKSVTTHEAKTRLSSLLKEVEQGKEVEIRRGEVPVARLTPIRGAKPRGASRPRTGTITSSGATYEADAFDALDERAMERLGFS